MPKRFDYRELEAHEKRAAFMHAAGATQATIALELETSQAQVREILLRPRVARYILLLSGMVADGIRDTVEATNEKIRATAARAFEVEEQMMEDLVDMGDQLDDPHVRIRAKLGATATAQDILDRAGNRAPTHVVNTNLNATMPSEHLDHLISVLKESQRLDQAVDVTPQKDTNENTIMEADASDPSLVPPGQLEFSW